MLVNSAVSPSQTFTETNIKYLVLITFLNYLGIQSYSNFDFDYLLIPFVLVWPKIGSISGDFTGKEQE